MERSRVPRACTCIDINVFELLLTGLANMRRGNSNAHQSARHTIAVHALFSSRQGYHRTNHAIGDAYLRNVFADFRAAMQWSPRRAATCVEVTRTAPKTLWK